MPGDARRRVDVARWHALVTRVPTLCYADRVQLIAVCLAHGQEAIARMLATPVRRVDDPPSTATVPAFPQRGA